jgi:putative transposase
MRYAFIRDNQHIWPVRRLCSTLDVHHSGYYAWLKQPTSKTARKRQQLSGLIKQILAGICWYLRLSQDSL